MKHIRGVNIGGWLVLERWITPAMFIGTDARDEYSLIQELGVEEARARLENHWKTFITKQHFQQIRAMGLNTVRVPVGYWLFADQDGFLGGSYKYVDTVFEWAHEYELDVILCLHGAPGSQNGNDHSGKRGRVGWFWLWNIRKSYKIIRQLCERYGSEKALIGIELVNEPEVQSWWRRWVLFRYYLTAGSLVEKLTPEQVSVVMSDAFQAERLVPKIVGLPLSRPVIDTHMYQLFSEEDRALDFSGHIEKTKGWGHELKRLSIGAKVLVGEWSAAMDELYDPVLKERARSFTKQEYAAYAREQRRVFEEAGTGWCYWTARTEDGGVWSLLDHPEYLDSKRLKQ